VFVIGKDLMWGTHKLPLLRYWENRGEGKEELIAAGKDIFLPSLAKPCVDRGKPKGKMRRATRTWNKGRGVQVSRK